MEKGQLVRRIVHLSTPVFLVYYFLPDPLWDGGLRRLLGLLLLLAAVLVAEGLRLIFRPRIVGMRDYEETQISAGAWAAIGMTVAFVFFPLGYSAPALMGMGWIDPLMGDMRKAGSAYYPYMPMLAYFFIALVSMSAIMGLSAEVLAASIVATPVAILAERMKSRIVDDDFLMIVVPLIVIAAVFAVWP